MVSVTASEMQKNFGEWHDRAYEEPVEITRYGRTTAFLVSARLFHELWASFRKAVPVGELSEADMALIMQSKPAVGHPYNLDDIPDIDEDEAPSAPKV